MKPARTPQQPPTPIRLSKDLKEWLQREAAKNMRSLNGEVNLRLEASRQADPSAEKAKGPNRANG